ncbi:Peroxisome chaperone and import receptor [Blyttiomyces sp. JEL0837]|nr:Peroxisome chaperone and import receptor [Blyttiomyces sp. JEL0837]
MVDADDGFLDDVLDSFDSTTINPPSTSSQTKPQNDTSKAASAPAFTDDETFDDEFAKQLAAGMEQLMKEYSGTSSASDIQATMDHLVESVKNLQSGLDAPVPGTGSSSSKPSATAAKGGASFQAQISETMNKLRDSSEKVDAQVAESAANVDEAQMEQMMKELEQMMGSAEFESMFGGMMEQLMSKDLLMEPMKDLATKYPAWLSENESKIEKADFERYQKQHLIVKEILVVYESSLPKEEESKRVVELMQQMQECGNPPEAIIQDLAPGLELGPDGMPKMPTGAPGEECVVM